MYTLSKAEEKAISQRVKEMNDLEDKIALERFGVTYEELDYDDKELVTWEMQDFLGIGLD